MGDVKKENKERKNRMRRIGIGALMDASATTTIITTTIDPGGKPWKRLFETLGV